MNSGSDVSDAVVRARDITHSYGSPSPVLDQVGFELFPTEVLGLVGINGSGKTTLLRLTAGLMRPDSGTLSVAAAAMSVVLDRTPFQEALSGAENLRYQLAMRGHATNDGAAWLTTLGMADAADASVGTYSFGMRRRLALAEAFAAAPRLLLLDEPTLGLDPLGREALAGALREAVGRGCAVLAATNDARFAEESCSRVLLIHDGRVVASGVPGDLIAGLEAPTILSVAFEGPSPGGTPPAGVTRVGPADGGGSQDFASAEGSSALAALCAWFAAAGSDIRSVRVREPGLADVLRARAGVDLTAEAESSP